MDVEDKLAETRESRAQPARVADATVQLQECTDGVWVHLSVGSQNVSINLSADPFTRKFALAYHEAMLAAAPQPAKDR